MGYCIDLTEHNFKIKKENINNAINALKYYMKTNERPMWITPNDVIEAEIPKEVFAEIRYVMTIDENGDYILDYFRGEKLGDDQEVLNSIAEYVEPNSFIEFEGEDGDIFRLVFKDNKCEYKFMGNKGEDEF